MNICKITLAGLLACGIALTIDSESWAQKGRGHGGGHSGGGKSFKQGSFGSNSRVRTKGDGRTFDSDIQQRGRLSNQSFDQPRGSSPDRATRSLDRTDKRFGGLKNVGDTADDRLNPADDRRLIVEQQKLEHRQLVAEHLRRVGELNGNPQLAEVADRLEINAQEHYQHQLERIDSEQFRDLNDTVSGDRLNGSEHGQFEQPQSVLNKPLVPAHSKQDGTFSESSSLRESAARTADIDRMSATLSETPAKTEPNVQSIRGWDNFTSGRENAYQRRLLAEERKLNQRMNVSQTLRTMAKRQGNPQLLEAAQQMEEMTLQHYTDQLSKLTDFQAVGEGR